MELVYRPLANTDHRRLSEFASYLERNGQITDAFFWPPELIVPEFYSGRGWGAFAGDEMVAYVLWRDLPQIREISSLVTHPDWRGRGVMAELLRHIFSDMRQGEELWLEVHEENLRAQKLYKNSGFEQTGKRPRYYRDGGAALLFAYKKG